MPPVSQGFLGCTEETGSGVPPVRSSKIDALERDSGRTGRDWRGLETASMDRSQQPEQIGAIRTVWLDGAAAGADGGRGT